MQSHCVDLISTQTVEEILANFPRSHLRIQITMGGGYYLTFVEGSLLASDCLKFA